MGEPDSTDLLRGALAAFASDAGVDHAEAVAAMTAFLSENATEDFTCVMRGLPPTPAATYPGVEGVTRAWKDWGEVFEKVRIELEEVRTSPDHVVMLVEQVARTRHGGVEMRQPSAVVFVFDGGRASRVEFHLDRDEALRVAGL